MIPRKCVIIFYSAYQRTELKFKNQNENTVTLEECTGGKH